MIQQFKDSLVAAIQTVPIIYIPHFHFSYIDEIIEELENSKRRNVDGQIGFGDLSGDSDDFESAETSFIYPDLEEFPQELLLKYVTVQNVMVK